MQDLDTMGTDLASLPGGMEGINNKGQVDGESCDIDPLTAQLPLNCRAYLWQNKTVKDLNELIPVDSPLYLLFGFGINHAGEIAGFATPCDRDDDGAECCGR
jgi:hypothetical protein